VTDPVARANGLLALMREPHKYVSQVDEVCESLDGMVHARSVSIEFHPGSANDSDGFIYVDLVHPKKGALLDLKLFGDPRVVRKLNHFDHLTLSQFLIYYRFDTVFDSCHVRLDHEESFLGRMDEALVVLLKLPEAEPDLALSLLADVFDLQERALNAVLQTPDIAVDPVKMAGLFRLCEMLASRYLVVAELKAGDEKDVLLEYRYTQSVEDTPDLARRLPPWRTRQGLRINRWFRGTFGVPPISTRVHIPWAKRTDHYSLQVGAPEGYFFSAHEIVASPHETDGRYQLLSPSDEVKWSRNTNLGRRAHAFVSQGRLEDNGRSLNVWYQVLERPGRSTLRLTVTAWLLFVASSVVFAATIFGRGSPANDVPALVVASLSLVAFIVEATLPSVGPYGSPLVVRVGSICLTALALGLALWVMIKQPRSEFAFHLSDIPGVCVCILILLIATFATDRYRHLRRTHLDVIAHRVGIANNMY
jgi:hypothetical protein